MRLRDIGEARIAFESERDGGGPSTPPGGLAPSYGPADERLARRFRLPWLAAAGLGLLAAVFGLLWLRSSRMPSPLLQSALEPPAEAQLLPLSGFALSPDGHSLAFVARDADGAVKLWVRSLAALQARPLAGTEEALAPFWSPDGRDIGFFANENLKRVSAVGGAVQVLAGPTVEPKGGAWNPEGRIVYVPDYRTGLFEVPANGGEPRALTTLDVEKGELSHRWPQFLPDGQTLLFLVQTADAGADDDRSRIEILDTSGGRHEILKANSSAAYATPGRLVFWREGSIYSQQFDPKRLRLRGEPQLVANAVGFTFGEWATFTVSEEGTLVYHREPDLPWRLEWRDRSGKLLYEAAPEGKYFDPALSPDGRRVAYVTDNITVWILDLARGTNSRLSFEAVDHYSPTWAPHGDWLAYAVLKQREAGSEIRRRRSSGRAGRSDGECRVPGLPPHGDDSREPAAGSQ